MIRVLCGAGRRPSREDILQWLRRETPRGCDAVPDRGSRWGGDKVVAVDAAGRSVRQTIIDAWRVR